MQHDERSTDLAATRGTTLDEPPRRLDGTGGEHDWIDDPQDLPARPRRRLLTPLTGALLAALLLAGGFLAGVVVEKGQASSTSSAGATGTSAAGRFGRLAGAGAGGGAGSAASGGFAGARGGATVGQVAFIQGTTLYVRDAQGNTVKVTTSPGSTVTKSVKSSTKGIHPGETVVVTGTAGSGGVVAAESIRVGGEAGGVPGSAPGASGAKAAGGEPALFGSGG